MGVIQIVSAAETNTQIRASEQMTTAIITATSGVSRN